MERQAMEQINKNLGEIRELFYKNKQFIGRGYKAPPSSNSKDTTTNQPPPQDPQPYEHQRNRNQGPRNQRQDIPRRKLPLNRTTRTTPSQKHPKLQNQRHRYQPQNKPRLNQQGCCPDSQTASTDPHGTSDHSRREPDTSQRCWTSTKHLEFTKDPHGTPRKYPRKNPTLAKKNPKPQDKKNHEV